MQAKPEFVLNKLSAINLSSFAFLSFVTLRTRFLAARIFAEFAVIFNNTRNAKWDKAKMLLPSTTLFIDPYKVNSMLAFLLGV